jgi:hypothetical protein
MDWSTKFKWQYNYAKNKLRDVGGYAQSWAGTIQQLDRLLGADGFTTAEAPVLDQLRKKVVSVDGKVTSIDQGILNAVKAGGNAGPAVTDEAKLKASVLKFLMHCYLLHTSGNRTLWLHSLPKSFFSWSSIHFNSWAGTAEEVRTLLKDTRETFGEVDKRHLASAAQQSLAWCLKTNALLANANSRNADTKAKAIEVVKRWFGDPALSEADLGVFVNTLSKGFKDITAMLNKGSLILTDWAPLRTASSQDEINFLNAEAFTFASRAEGLDVVYIEKSFFVDNPGNVLKGPRNWSRILIHELTHLICGTQDVKNGQARYAWYGIGPHRGYPGSDCIRNADNWAFFSADCAGVLTQAEAAVALKIV